MRGEKSNSLCLRCSTPGVDSASGCKRCKPYPVDLVARILLAVLHESSAEVARSKHDVTVRNQVSELVKGAFGLLTR